jgi:hypothetical protein
MDFCLLIIRHVTMGKHLGEDVGMHTQNNKQLEHSHYAEGDIDEHTFVDWKNELQRTLPSFWQSMR